MKKTILTLLTFIIFFNTYAQKRVWPYTDFAYAKIYMYNLNSKLQNNYPIIKDGKLTAMHITNNKKLAYDQTQQIIKITNKNIKGLLAGISKCFNPHHAIVFFDKNNRPVASIMPDFECQAIRLQPAKKTKTLKKELSEKEINKQLEILNFYKKIVEQLDFPVFKTHEEYLYYQKNNALKNVKNLTLIGKNGIKQLEQDKNRRFDLSGICQYKNKIYVVADKKENHFVYRLDSLKNSFTVYPEINLCPNAKIDFEGIDIYNHRFFIIDEWFNNVLSVQKDTCSLRKHNIELEKIGIDRSTWGNKGFEGIACDNEHKILYLAKEREARRIFKIDMRTGSIEEPFKDVLEYQMQGHDISDMKYENNYLYLLERSTGAIVRVDLKTKETKSYSYQYLVYKNGQRIFKNKFPQYGMAEALLLTKDEIWIGLDNNGDPVSEYGKSLGLREGNNTVILIFKRPEGF